MHFFFVLKHILAIPHHHHQNSISLLVEVLCALIVILLSLWFLGVMSSVENDWLLDFTIILIQESES